MDTSAERPNLALSNTVQQTLSVTTSPIHEASSERLRVDGPDRVKRALVLTSTLKPGASVFMLKRAELEVRRSDYLTSVELWSKDNVSAWDCAYLVDNSPDISADAWNEFKEQVADRSEGRITALHVDIAPDTGSTVLQKGREEAKLLDAAVERLDGLGVTYFAKVTGRLFVSNANRAIPPSRHAGITAAISNRLHFSDTRFFAMPVHDWTDYFRGMDADVDEPQKFYLEHVFARRAMRAVGDGTSFVSMPWLPRFVGTSGSMDVDYGSFKRRVRETVRDVVRLPYHRYRVTL